MANSHAKTVLSVINNMGGTGVEMVAGLRIIRINNLCIENLTWFVLCITMLCHIPQ